VPPSKCFVFDAAREGFTAAFVAGARTRGHSGPSSIGPTALLAIDAPWRRTRTAGARGAGRVRFGLANAAGVGGPIKSSYRICSSPLCGSPIHPLAVRLPIAVWPTIDPSSMEYSRPAWHTRSPKRAGRSYLNLIAQPAEAPWSWRGRVIFYHSDLDAVSVRRPRKFLDI
jgi:hypothetical protein